VALRVAAAHVALMTGVVPPMPWTAAAARSERIISAICRVVAIAAVPSRPWSTLPAK
jgi:hypothetical protein